MAEYKFTKECRLLNSSDYGGVFDKAEYKVSCRFILMLAIKHRNQSRLGLVVSKKNISKAVERNRVKRAIRESFRKNKSQIPNLDVVVLIRKGIDVLPNVVISSKMNSLWNDLCAKSAEQPTRTNPSVIGT